MAAIRAVAPPEFRAAFQPLRRELKLRRRLPRLSSAIAEARPYSMVPTEWMRALARQTLQLVDEGISGSVVECGAWRGGIGILLGRVLASLRDERPIFLCDSFEGLPPPEPIDGEAALEWSRDREHPYFHDNCRASLAELEQVLKSQGLDSRITLVKGWFNESLPAAKADFGPIALLRIDADWHSSVTCCLEELYDVVVPNGFVIFDDYDTWDGCATAVHEFLGRRRLGHRILHDGCAYFRKG